MKTRTMDGLAVPDKTGNETSRPKERRWGEGRSNPLARVGSDKLGLSESYVEQLLRAKSGSNIRCAELITIMLEQGATTQATRYFEPIRRAYENRKPQPLTLQLVEDANEACHAEHMAEIRYLETKSDAALSLEIRALQRAIARMTALLDAAQALEQNRMRGQS